MTNPLLHILLGLIIIIISSRVLNLFFKKIYQPLVISEMLAGILIGPSFFGYIFPDVYNYIIPKTTIPYFGIISQLGIMIYMFIIGLEFDFSVLKNLKNKNNSNKYIIAIAKASIVIPFLLGLLLAALLIKYNIIIIDNINYSVFILFIGVSMSVTAFPVLARILADQEITKTTIGSLALTCAAVNDVTAWCLLAFVLSIAQAKISSAFVTLILTIIFILLMLFVLKPLAKKLSNYCLTKNTRSDQQITILFVALLSSALIAEYIGIHAIFGAFLLGVIAPRNNKVITDLSHKLQDVICIIFLPAFFAYIGMKTQINLINSYNDFLLCLLIIFTATVGKFGGTYLTARLFGIQKNLAAGLGFLMNTRGLVELIVLNIGLETEIITPQLFTILVIMALVTTCMTGTALHFLKPKD